MKTCKSCQKQFSWKDFGSTLKYNSSSVCPDCENINNDELISICYDYIAATTQKQGRLLPAKTLFGDGSRFNNNFKVFKSTYNGIKTYLNS